MCLQALNRDHKKQVQGLSTAFINKQNNHPDTPEAALSRAVSQLEATGHPNPKPPIEEPQEGEVPRNPSSFAQGQAPPPPPGPTPASTPAPRPQHSDDHNHPGNSTRNVNFSGTQRASCVPRRNVNNHASSIISTGWHQCLATEEQTPLMGMALPCDKHSVSVMTFNLSVFIFVQLVHSKPWKLQECVGPTTCRPANHLSLSVDNNAQRRC